MKGRIFRTTAETPDKQLIERVGDLICGLVVPFIFEIIDLKQDDTKWDYIVTCKVTGKLSDIGKTWMKELDERE